MTSEREPAESEKVKPGTVFIIDTAEEHHLFTVTGITSDGYRFEGIDWVADWGSESGFPNIISTPIRFDIRVAPHANEDFWYERAQESSEGFWRSCRLTPTNVRRATEVEA